MKIAIELNGIGELLELKQWLANLEAPSSTLSLQDLAIGDRTINILARDDITTIDQLINKTEIDLLKIPNMSRRAVNAVIGELSKRGLRLKPKS